MIIFEMNDFTLNLNGQFLELTILPST